MHRSNIKHMRCFHQLLNFLVQVGKLVDGNCLFDHHIISIFLTLKLNVLAKLAFHFANPLRNSDVFT